MYYELFRQTLYHLRQHKLRSALVIFGIAWGTLSVVLLMSLSTSFHKNMIAQFNAMFGPDTQSFAIRTTTQPYHGYPTNRPIRLKADTIMDLRKKVPQIKWISPLLGRSPFVAARNVPPMNTAVFGVSTDWGKLLNFQFTQGHGHFFTPFALAKAEYEVVIDQKTADTFFKKQNPIGQTLLINGVSFRVIGLNTNDALTHSFMNGLYIPYTTFQKLWGSDDGSWFNIVSANHSEQTAVMEQAIRRTLATTLDIPPVDANGLFTQGVGKFRDMTNALFVKLQSFFSVAGGLALMIGGLGVANILFLMVNQRSREIGLTMALGAQDKHILLQILIESFLLVAIGGFFGFIFSWLSIIGLQQFPELPFGKPTLSLSVLFLTIGILAVLGLLAGYFPARKAMRLNPVEAFNKVG